MDVVCMDGWMYGCMYGWMYFSGCMYGCIRPPIHTYMACSRVCMDVWTPTFPQKILIKKKHILLTKLYFKLEGFCSFVWGGARRWPTIVKTERFGEAQARANCYVCLDVCMDGCMYGCMYGWMYGWMYVWMYGRQNLHENVLLETV